MKPEEFEETLADLKTLIAEINGLQEEGFSRAEIEAHLVFDIISDDLAKKRASKKKARAKRILKQTLTDLEEKGIDPKRLMDKWDELIDFSNFDKGKTRTKTKRKLSSYQLCIKKMNKILKKDPRVEWAIKPRSLIAEKKGIIDSKVRGFEIAVEFCKDHHGELTDYINKEIKEEN